MIQNKTTNNNQAWSVNLRSRVGLTVTHLSKNWTNVTGKNAEPGTNNDWELNAGGSESALTEDVTLNLSGGKKIGAKGTGTFFPTGTTFTDWLKEVGIEYIDPIFTSFTVGAQSVLVEVGTTLSGLKTFNWGITLNNGVVPTITIYDQTALSNLSLLVENDGSFETAITTIKLNANNATQEWKGIANNSTGPNVSSSIFKVTSQFNRYWKAVNTLPASSVDGTANRTYANSLEKEFKSNGSNTFTLSTGIIENKFIVLLPPGITIVSVIDITNLSSDMTSDYVLTPITIKDAGGTDRNYNQYLFNPAGPYPTSANHVIKTS